jgi:hypothetical protein
MRVRPSVFYTASSLVVLALSPVGSLPAGASNAVTGTARSAGSPRTAPLSITTTSLPSDDVGVAYQAAVKAAGGTTPYVWSRTAGSKPPGLSFSTTGLWTGTPTVSGTYTFTVQVTDHSGAKASKVLKISIAEGVAPTWSQQTSVDLPGESYLEGISCVSAASCMTVGFYSDTSTTGTPVTETWNGKTWSLESVPTPKAATSSYLLAVSCLAASWCRAVGYYAIGSGILAERYVLIETWDGKAWSIQQTSNPANTSPELHAIACETTTFCVAVGSVEINGAGSPLAERWNGTSWTIQTQPGTSDNSYLLGVSCATTSFCMAVGYTLAGSSLAETWNGQSWGLQGNVNLPESESPVLSGVSCSLSTSCVAVGDYLPGASGTLPLAAEWNGSTWSIQSTPLPGGTGVSLQSVVCVATTACIAVGFGPLAEIWNGKSWTAQVPPDDAGDGGTMGLASVSCTSQISCTAAGITGLIDRYSSS